jgi:hypothetical protein
MSWMDSLEVKNVWELPGNLMEDGSYVLGNTFLAAGMSTLSALFPNENDGSGMDQMRISAKSGFADTMNFVYDASRGCRAKGGETASDSFMMIPNRLVQSWPYIFVFGAIDMVTKKITGDDGTLGSIFERASDPSFGMKNAGAQGVSSWFKFAAWNGYDQSIAFHMNDSVADPGVTRTGITPSSQNLPPVTQSHGVLSTSSRFY